MTEPHRQAPRKVKVQDKRVSAANTSGEHSPSQSDVPDAGPDEPQAQEPQVPEAAEHDYLQDLRRLQAEFDNYRKRVLREQTAMAARASARLIEGLLPVLDNFEAAIAHGEGGPGVEMVYKQLRTRLGEDGLQEIEAAGKPFDPQVHEAFEAHEDANVTQPMVTKVLRPGDKVNGQIVRPAMVSVARPLETGQAEAAEG